MRAHGGIKRPRRLQYLKSGRMEIPEASRVIGLGFSRT